MTRLSYLRGSGLTPSWSTKTLSATQLRRKERNKRKKRKKIKENFKKINNKIFKNTN